MKKQGQRLEVKKHNNDLVAKFSPAGLDEKETRIEKKALDCVMADWKERRAGKVVERVGCEWCGKLWTVHALL